MMPGRSALGAILGVLLGLGVVALVSSGIYSSGAQTTIPQYRLFTNTTSTQSVTTTANMSRGWVTASNATLGIMRNQVAKASPPSLVNSIARQPVTLTGFVFLPIFAALLFGFVLYRVSRARNERGEPPEGA